MEKTFLVDDGTGKKRACRALFTFHSDDTEKDYIFYTEAGGKTGDVFVSVYDPSEEELHLSEVEDDEEFRMLIQVFREANKE